MEIAKLAARILWTGERQLRSRTGNCQRNGRTERQPLARAERLEACDGAADAVRPDGICSSGAGRGGHECPLLMKAEGGGARRGLLRVGAADTPAFGEHA